MTLEISTKVDGILSHHFILGDTRKRYKLSDTKHAAHGQPGQEWKAIFHAKPRGSRGGEGIGGRGIRKADYPNITRAPSSSVPEEPRWGRDFMEAAIFNRPLQNQMTPLNGSRIQSEPRCLPIGQGA